MDGRAEPIRIEMATADVRIVQSLHPSAMLRLSMLSHIRLLRVVVTLIGIFDGAGTARAQQPFDSTSWPARRRAGALDHVGAISCRQ